VAGKGGGAWKVAYADFITALMAFFLVMWICTQDQKIKQAVAHYFMDPAGGTPIGASNKPSKSGAIFNAMSQGAVPESQNVALGRGRNSHTRKGENSPATKRVADWLHANEEKGKYWQDQAKRAVELASAAPEVRNKSASQHDAAVRILAKQMRDEMTQSVVEKTTDLHQELLFEALAEVNWDELAEDLIGQ
jgi:flagellar motor protein MotB